MISILLWKPSVMTLLRVTRISVVRALPLLLKDIMRNSRLTERCGNLLAWRSQQLIPRSLRCNIIFGRGAKAAAI